jgi:hypothetical protein
MKSEGSRRGREIARVKHASMYICMEKEEHNTKLS